MAESRETQVMIECEEELQNSGFEVFRLKPSLHRAIVDCGFEHPSKTQEGCIPRAIYGLDILCQAESGEGKTAIFVMATLQQIDPVDGQAMVLVLCPTSELAVQIRKEYERFAKYMPIVEIGVFVGGHAMEYEEDMLVTNCPHIVIGTPGRILALIQTKMLSLRNTKHLVVDECDDMLEQFDMRREFRQIFRSMPRRKQVMMFSPTGTKDLRPLCKRFMRDLLAITAPRDRSPPPLRTHFWLECESLKQNLEETIHRLEAQQQQEVEQMGDELDRTLIVSQADGEAERPPMGFEEPC